MRLNDFKIIKPVAIIVLLFFCWTFCICEIPNAFANNKQAGKSSQQSAISNQSSQPKPQRPEERFQTVIGEIEGILSDTVTDTDTKKNKLKTKKSDLESLDTQVRKQFSDTEKFLKEKNLANEILILDRHYKFVKHYEDNLKELNDNLDAIDKSKTKSEADAAIGRAKAHLEKVKPPKRHIFDPNKLPHRTAEPVWIEPRTSPEQFLKDSQKSLVNSHQSKQILIASNGSLKGLISNQPSAFSYEQPKDSPMLIALADPPTDADLAETIEVQFTPAIRAKAAELNHSPVKIYNFVRNSIEFVPIHGSIQGADMCLQTKQCNAFDTASLLIALLRSSGIHARYAYGTVEIPSEKAKNWTGGFTNAMDVLDIMGMGGIPVKGMTVGGEIKYIRFENVWVEAYIDYIPSRGARHKVGDTWIPLDASFKQYNYTQGIDIKSAVPFDAQSFVDQIKNTATINETEGYVTNVNSLYIQQQMQDYQTQVQNYITQNYPNATVGDVLGKKEIIKQEFTILLGTLPYNDITAGAKWSSLPDNLRHKITFNVTKDIYDSELGTPINITKSLPELAGKKITLSYSPATSADEAVINSYLPKPHADGTPMQPSELPSSLPAYLINLKPELRIDGVVVATGTSVGMGNTETFRMTFTAPNESPDVITNNIEAGEYLGIALDLGRISPEQMSALKAKLEATKAKLEAQDFTNLTKDDLLGDLLYATALSYHAELGVMSQGSAKTMGVAAITLPSETIFSFELKRNFAFGIPISVSSGGLAMDADRLYSLVKSLDGNTEKPKQFFLSSGMNGSALEHSVPEQLFSTQGNPAQGISAVKALQIASEQGIPIYTINQTNINTILPQLQVDGDVKADIQNAVNAGKEVTVSKSNINFNGWNGCGYIIIDPATGAGAYMISGGMNGALVYAAWVAGLVILIILATAGLVAIALLVSIAFEAIITAALAAWPIIKLTILYATPIIIRAYNYCSNITFGSPTIVKALCTILISIMTWE